MKTHVADRKIADWAWRTCCGRTIKNQALIVSENPTCRTCAKWKWSKRDESSSTPR